MANCNYSSLPVYAKADVVVCGGGTAGAFAAIAAAREGADVLLIEQFGGLGGTATNGLVTPVMRPHTPGEKLCSYLSEELTARLVAENACTEDGRQFDPMMLKIELEQMCVEAGVRLLYHTFIPDVVVENGGISAVVIANKAGLSLVEGKVFIDCTGDGDISVRAGAEYNKGNPDTGVNQPMSLRYIIDGVDVEEWGKFFEELKQKTGVNSAASAWGHGSYVYAHCCRGNDVTLTPIFNEAVENGDLSEEDHLYWQAFSMPGRLGSVAFNCPEFFVHIDGTNPEDLTIAQVEGKKRVVRQLAFYKKYMRGFENAYIAEIAVMVGVRESREIVTDYVMKAEDLLNKRKFSDGICQSNYPIDIHGKVLINDYNNLHPDDNRPWYDIPFRSLLVKGISNLFVAGRCLGAEFLVESSMRVQHSCRSSGEAAGIGAALAVKRGTPIRSIGGEEVRGIMISKGAKFVEEA